ncbi:GNAT family N-acetyltransferase [Caulobacter mirabilis]|uniref:GNAT family N-acetyltransferase n=1 Tax=Caulobacter mirabilis TaxID=69666 RepID=A0A2D2AUS7_9CAUL|nr:GNAT family N-acetyltransferase [Caulobacter mirabilis]ATQ41764.1 GNAT family N-acetyltransferase [Caulobacter mirabilis]
MSQVTLRRAVAADAPAIFKFVMDLAIHHEHADEVETTLADIEREFFGPTPHAYCELAELDGELLGFTTWFYSFSSWTGRRGIYLEDLFVTDSARGTGAGRLLMADLARRCVAEKLPRIEWAVIPENEGGMAFYSKLGAAPQDHAIWRLDGEALTRLAAS